MKDTEAFEDVREINYFTIYIYIYVYTSIDELFGYFGRFVAAYKRFVEDTN